MAQPGMGALLLALLLLLTLPAFAVAATVPDSVQKMPATLPAGRSTTSAVWTGQYAYIFGGFSGAPTNQIVRYNPSTDTVNVMGAVLPSARTATSAAWDGQYAYVFGGFDGLLLNQIVRYDPAADTVSVLSAILPSGRSETSAAWDGQNAYIFGGFDGLALNQIVRYSPSSNGVTVMTATLPSGRTGTAAVAGNGNLYVFGGSVDGNQIVRYNAAGNQVTLLSATLPTARYKSTAVWDGLNAYVFGGSDANGAVNQIVRFNPGGDAATVMAPTLPGGRSEASSVWNGLNAYVFGGCCDGASVVSDIVRYTTSNEVPAADFTVAANGLTITVDAGASTDTDGSIATYAWGWGDGSAAGSGRTSAHTYTTSGTHLVRLNVTDNRGAVGSKTVSVNVSPGVTSSPSSSSPATSSNPSSSSASSSGGASNAASSSSSASSSASGASQGVVAQASGSGSVYSASVGRVEVNGRVEVRFDETDESGLERVEMILSSGGSDVLVVVERSDTLNASWGLPEADGLVFGYVSIKVYAGGQLVENPNDFTTIDFRVAKHRIDDAGIRPIEVHLFRWSQGVWDDLPTDPNGEEVDDYRFIAAGPGHGYFAIAGDAARTTGGSLNWFMIALGVIVVNLVIGGILYAFRTPTLRTP